MRESLKGKVIRIHSDDGHADFGRIIYDFVENDDVLTSHSRLHPRKRLVK